ncbi:hypothetical protein V5T82_03490 [Magnetovibrio sp. PR-2]|uniref:hypothetical protein n=1 Tax=Magnetovibrio sp. PR-2 TaxID=3120356 RepID=UPI002FCE50C2
MSYADEQLFGLIAYVRHEIDRARNVKDLDDIILLLDLALKQHSTASPIQGLKHIQAEYPLHNIHRGVNVTTRVPKSLVSTFYDLSTKMNQLQYQNPELFANASTTLYWIANNDCLVD